MFEALGYRCYFATAERRGYSGVAVFSRRPIHRYTIGCGIDIYDREGRLLEVELDSCSIISVYMPSGSSGDERQAFKMRWLSDFMKYIETRRKSCDHLIVSGDFNICHRPIDIHDPIRNQNSSGFLIEEREWMTTFLDSGFIDSFRYFCSDPHHYTWWSYRRDARARNLGWRIDYHMCSRSLRSRLKNARILNQAHHSDHCPLLLELK